MPGIAPVRNGPLGTCTIVNRYNENLKEHGEDEYRQRIHHQHDTHIGRINPAIRFQRTEYAYRDAYQYFQDQRPESQFRRDWYPIFQNVPHRPVLIFKRKSKVKPEQARKKCQYCTKKGWSSPYVCFNCA